MEKDVVMGPELKAVFKVEGGKVIVGLEYEGKQMSALSQVSMDIEAYGQLLKDAIPGRVDDMAIDAFVALLKIV